MKSPKLQIFWHLIFTSCTTMFTNIAFGVICTLGYTCIGVWTIKYMYNTSFVSYMHHYHHHKQWEYVGVFWPSLKTYGPRISYIGSTPTFLVPFILNYICRLKRSVLSFFRKNVIVTALSRYIWFLLYSESSAIVVHGYRQPIRNQDLWWSIS